MTATTATAGTPEAADIRVVSGNPTPEELAAVTAVIQAMAAERDEVAAAPRRQNGWLLAQRPMRTPIVHGRSRWSTFSG
jgi:hypothetical protein